MAKWIRLAALLLLAFLAAEWWSARTPAGDPVSAVPAESPSAAAESNARYPSFLPPEAITTLELIERGGPFPYDRDGTTFQNRERLLPDRPRGYYREYTVETPGSRDRGARRIVTGGQPPEVYYYTDDHYRSFRQLEVGP
jgi:guanyl-specific ribonuclease Sa